MSVRIRKLTIAYIIKKTTPSAIRIEASEKHLARAVALPAPKPISPC
jgi:hypothetical protein